MRFVIHMSYCDLDCADEFPSPSAPGLTYEQFRHNMLTPRVMNYDSVQECMVMEFSAMAMLLRFPPDRR